MKRFVYWLLTISLIIPPELPASTISAYTPVSLQCADSNGFTWTAIRHFLKDGISSYLLLNPRTLESSTSPVSAVTVQKKTPIFDGKLAKLTSAPYKLQNQGLTHSLHPVKGIFLTVDLCPTKRPFEQELFESLLKIAARNGKALPLAICISGGWLARHPAEVNWLKEQVTKGLFDITWVNHSLTHFYDPSLPINRNFMLSKRTDQRQEILSNEILMLETGITPSPFFRFPGLVSDEQLTELLRDLSLIPLGSDAWLAKGESPVDGSIILVHGNGNEPAGISRLMLLLRGGKLPEFLTLSYAVTGGN